MIRWQPRRLALSSPRRAAPAALPSELLPSDTGVFEIPAPAELALPSRRCERVFAELVAVEGLERPLVSELHRMLRRLGASERELLELARGLWERRRGGRPESAAAEATDVPIRRAPDRARVFESASG